MNPAAVLAVVVKAQGVIATNAELASVQKTLEKTEGKVTSLGNTMVSSGKKMTSVGKSLSRNVTTPILGVGIAAGVMSAKFHRSMNLIATDAGGSVKEVKILSGEVLKLAEHSEFGPQKLADALFYVESAGLRGAKAIKTLNSIQRAAMAGNADLEHATFGTVGAMNALGKEGKNVEKILATMNAVVGHGHLRLEELTMAMSTGTVGVAKTFGLTFEGFGSAVAFFTRMSEPAQQAATRLRQTITHLASASTKKAKESLEGIGVSIDVMSEKMKNTGRLGPVIKYLADHLKGLSESAKNQVLTEAFGGGRFGTQIREALANLGLLFKTEKEIAKTATVKRLKHSERIQEQSDAVKLKKLWSTVQVQLIKLGDSILPVIVPIFTKVVNVLVSASQWFTHLSHSQRTLIVVIALVVAAIGPLLVIFGSLIRNGGYVIQFIGKLITWFSRSSVAAEEVVTANAAISDSYATTGVAAQESAAAQIAAMEEVTAAQKVAMAERAAQLPIGGLSGQQSFAQVMPAAEEGAQMSLFAQPVTQEATVAAETAGAGAAGTFASSMAAMIPGALAAVGLANIITSVVSGDTGNAMKEAGGAAGGALIGGIAGSIIPGVGTIAGALAGAGIGAVVADFFGPGGPVESKIEKAMRATGKSFKNSLSRQDNAFTGLHESVHQVHRASRKVHQATHAVQRAEGRLEHSRENDSGARKVLRDEIRLREAKLKLAHANSKLTQSEHLQGIRRQLAIKTLKGTVQAEKQRVQTTTHALHGFEHEAQVALKKGAGLKRLNHIEEEITRTSKGKHRAELSLNKTLEETANLIGPKYAQKLKHIKTVQEEISAAEAKASKHFKATHQIIPNTLQEAIHAWKRNREATEASGKALHHTQERYGPFKSESHNAMQKAQKDVENFSEVGTKGLSTFASAMNTFAGQLGVANTHFSITGGNKKPKTKRQTGGMVVPGGGTGDKVAMTAMVEPGEVVHVLNMRAAKDREKLGHLETLNQRIPRFQKGGTVNIGSADMSSGKEPQILHDLSALSAELHKIVYVISGARTPAHSVEVGGFANDPHTRGEAADIGVGSALRDSMFSVTERALKAVGLYRPFYPPDPAEVNHVQLFGKQMGAFLSSAPKLAKLLVHGPDGQLKNTDQKALDLIQAMGQKWLNAHAPKIGTGGGGVVAEGLAGSGDVMAQMGRVLFGHGANKIGAAGIIGNAWGESNLNPAAVGTGGGGLFGFTTPPISLQNLHEYAAQVHKPWTDVETQMDFMLNHGGTGMIPIVNAASSPGEAAKIFMEGWEHPGIPRLSVREEGAAQAYAAGWQKGGAAKPDKDGKASPIAKSIKNVLGGLKKGKNLPKYKGALKRVGRHIDAIGLNQKELHRLQQLEDMTKTATQYQEYAENASTLTRSIENPVNSGKEEVIQGIFKGHPEGEWLNQQLGALLRLRGKVVGEYKMDSPQLAQVKELMKEAKARLRHVQKAIREAEREKRELEKKIKDIEKAEAASKHELEKEINSLEHNLAEARRSVPPNDKAHKAAHDVAEARINEMERQKETKQQALDHSGAGPQKEIHDIKEHIRNIERDQKGRHRAEEGLTGTIIPKLTDKQTSIGQLLEGIKGPSGEIEGQGHHIVFSGLETLQGAGFNLEDIGNPPTIGSVGGEIFTVQNRLREIQEEAEKTVGVGEESDQQKELKELEKEIELIKLQRERIQQVQGPIIDNFPTVAEVATPAGLPFAGSFALGGVARARGLVLARVGEQGEEIVAPPQGSRVIPSHEVKQALTDRNQQPPEINFEEVHFHEDSGRVTGRANGRPFEKDVKEVNRKQARRSMSRTPGGKGLR